MAVPASAALLWACLVALVAIIGLLKRLRGQPKIAHTSSRYTVERDRIGRNGVALTALRYAAELVLVMLSPQCTGRRRRFCSYSTKWIWQLFRLALFAMALLPAFLRIAWFLVKNPRVRRGIRYGNRMRNSLDVYLPKDPGEPSTVLVFFVGGAWIIGYKFWGALMAKVLSAHGVLVVCPDYRNFPAGRVEDMLEDVDAAMNWVFASIAAYGGNPDRIFLAGQSAGAHLAALNLFSHANERLREKQLWTASQLKGAILISGPLDLIALAPHMHRRGLSLSVMHSIFKTTDEEDEDEVPQSGVTSSGACAQSPELPREVTSLLLTEKEHVEASRRLRASSPLFRVTPEVVRALPPITLLHGTADKTCPSGQSEQFQKALLGAGMDPSHCSLKLYMGKTHTSPILEDPISGSDPLVADMLNVLRGRPLHAQGPEGQASIRQQAMCPRPMIAFARWVVPF